MIGYAELPSIIHFYPSIGILYDISHPQSSRPLINIIGCLDVLDYRFYLKAIPFVHKELGLNRCYTHDLPQINGNTVLIPCWRLKDSIRTHKGGKISHELYLLLEKVKGLDRDGIMSRFPCTIYRGVKVSGIHI